MQYLFYGLLELYLRMYARYVHDAIEFIAQHTKLVLLNLCQFQNRLFEVLSPLNKSANQRKEYVLQHNALFTKVLVLFLF